MLLVVRLPGVAEIASEDQEMAGGDVVCLAPDIDLGAVLDGPYDREGDLPAETTSGGW